MGLPSHLIPALVCLLVCGSNLTNGRRSSITLEETIKTLNTLTTEKDPRCMELPVADVLAAPKNTSENETFCRAATALRQLYKHHECATKKFLSRLDRNLSSMAGKTTCPVNEGRRSTLKDFLERLRRIMQEKYSRG